MQTSDNATSMRIDKWLWCARFYKTRAIAVQALDKGHVHLNLQPVKASKEIKAGDMLTLQQGQDKRTVLVLGIASHRGPAPIAQSLYAETPESIAERTLQAEQRRLAPEPAHSVKDGRPTKRDRRHLQELRAWDKRWSTQK